MKIIQFGLLSPKLLFALIIPLCRNMRSFSFDLLKIANRFKQYPFILTCVLFFSEIIGGLIRYLLCCDKVSSSKKIKSLEGTIQERVFALPKYTPDHKREEYVQIQIVILITFLCLIENNVPVFVNQNIPYSITNLRYQLKMIGIIFYPWLCLRILKYKLYRHQYLALGLIVLGVIMVLIKSIYEYKSEWYWIVIYVLAYSVVGVERTYEKWLMYTKYWSPYKVLLYQGIIGLSMSIVFEVIVSLIPCPNGWFCEGNSSIENPLELFNNFDTDLLLYIVLFIVFVGNIYFWSTIVNFYFSPAHLAMTEIFSSIISMIINYKFSLPTLDVLTIVGYIVITFGIFIYNEIIILNIFGLGQNTFKKIRYRSQIDYSKIEFASNLLPEEEIESTIDLRNC